MTMRRRARLPYHIGCVLFIAAAFGCQVDQGSLRSARRPSVKPDPCAEQLHDLCGQLLLYHSRHGRLPASLGELAPGEGDEAARPACPVSRLAYMYNPEGVSVPNQPGRLVVYDATACHSGMRWSISVDEAGGGRTLTARVMLLPEDALRSALETLGGN